MLVGALVRQTEICESSMSLELGLTLLNCFTNDLVHRPRLPAASWSYLKLLKNLLCPRFAAWLRGRVLR